MKKIAVVSNGLSGGGAERVASILANYLDNNGYKVIFISAYSPKKEYKLNENVEYKFVEIKSKNPMLRLIERSLNLKRIVNDFGVEVVFSFIINELIPLVLSKVKVIPSLRIDPKSTDGDFVKRNIRKFVFRHADRIVFQTKQARDYFDKRIASKGLIIGNPIKADLPKWNSDGHSNYFMSACRISRQKNIPMMINAFKAFHEIHPEYVLHIYGDSDPVGFNKTIEQYAKEQGTEEYIVFKGHSTEIHKIMQNAQGFLLTSNYEGLSNSMLEAMAIGLPAICTDCPPGGAREYIENEKNGLLIPVGGEKELVDAMCKLVESSELQLTISNNSKYVRDVLNIDSVCSQWENLI